MGELTAKKPNPKDAFTKKEKYIHLKVNTLYLTCY